MNYYNDSCPQKVAWLRQLIADGLIPDGIVDDRSICDVVESDLRGFTQWHFFAGLGGWSLALEIAKWPANKPVATASCPCQPFSQTGKRLAHADPRHLWPEFYRLLKSARFPVCFGEQVSSKDGEVWLAGIRSDLETAGYESGDSDLCAASVQAPQKRQRLFWVAYANEKSGDERNPVIAGSDHRSHAESWTGFGGGEQPLWMAGAAEARHARAREGARDDADRAIPLSQREGFIGKSACDSPTLRLGDSHSPRPQGRRLDWYGGNEQSPWSVGVGVCGSDGKMRRLEPSAFPLVDGFPERVALIGGAGDAIVPQVAAEFIQACEEARADTRGGLGRHCPAIAHESFD